MSAEYNVLLLKLQRKKYRFNIFAKTLLGFRSGMRGIVCVCTRKNEVTVLTLPNRVGWSQRTFSPTEGLLSVASPCPSQTVLASVQNWSMAGCTNSLRG